MMLLVSACTQKEVPDSSATPNGSAVTLQAAQQAYLEHVDVAADPIVKYMNRDQLQKAIERTRRQMVEAAKKMEFIEAAQYRDELIKLEDLLQQAAADKPTA